MCTPVSLAGIKNTAATPPSRERLSSLAKTAAPEYAKNPAHLLARLRANLSAPRLVALIGVNTNFGNDQNPQMPVIVAQQRALAGLDPLSHYVDTEGAETLLPSQIHFIAKGSLEIGRRFATALRAREVRK